MTTTDFTIRPAELGARLRDGHSVLLVDVRTPSEFREVHARNAVNRPLERFDARAVADEFADPSQPIHLLCRSGSRARSALEALRKAGVEHAFVVDGGTEAWTDAGLPTVHGKRSMSLERQVRIVAGALVVLGVVLGAVHHIAWTGLAGFVGAGLVFAGVTDTCGMALLLARMPWNQVKSEAVGEEASDETNPSQGAACGICQE